MYKKTAFCTAYLNEIIKLLTLSKLCLFETVLISPLVKNTLKFETILCKKNNIFVCFDLKRQNYMTVRVANTATNNQRTRIAQILLFLKNFLQDLRWWT
jgi:hypothetical protein